MPRSAWTAAAGESCAFADKYSTNMVREPTSRDIFSPLPSRPFVIFAGQ